MVSRRPLKTTSSFPTAANIELARNSASSKEIFRIRAARNLRTNSCPSSSSRERGMSH